MGELSASRRGPRQPALPVGLIALLALLLLGSIVASLLVGAVRIPPLRMLALLTGAPSDAREAAVLWQIRLPRVALAIMVGAALGLAGAAQQGLFRNPLADPALVGVSAGAALAAVATIVLGGPLLTLAGGWLPPRALLPVAAFAGGLGATALALRLARASAGGSTAGLLLAGIAVNAVAGAGTGMLVTLSDDRQLRDITFWSMGSLASGGWPGAASAGACAIAAMGLLLPVGRRLDALLLGEHEADSLGVDVPRLRRRVVCAVALAVGGAVAAAGIVGFIGLVVPHLVRTLAGPRHGIVLPAAAALGAALLLLADAVARVAAAPAELPVGLVTALLGGPFFILLLLRQGRPMIEAQGVSVRAGGRMLLHDVSVQLRPGTVTAILGPNGAGKTTLLRVLSGVLRPQAGTVMIDGLAIDRWDRLALARRRAVLGQHQALEFGLTVADVVALGRLPHAGTAAARGNRCAIAKAQAAFALAPLWHRAYPSLSGGERQRTQLARIAAQLWQEPGHSVSGRALFLDEPTAALDLAQQGAALAFARSAATGGAAVLAVLHDLNQAATADAAVLLRGGVVMAAGPTADVMTPDLLHRCFDIDIELVRRTNGAVAFLTG